MIYSQFSEATWDELSFLGNRIDGYQTIILKCKNETKPVLHIFKDENSYLHFAIEVALTSAIEIDDPSTNGLFVEETKFRIGNKVGTYVDLRCQIPAYKTEFTELVKLVSERIFETDEDPKSIIRSVIANWKSFWANRNNQFLSEEEIIGLFCELKVLGRLIRINPANAISSWKGPLKEKHDFVFSDWSFEVKGTRSYPVRHTINGLDQLSPLAGKQLAFVSFSISMNTSNSESLPTLIGEITKSLDSHPHLVTAFEGLLLNARYNRFDERYYLDKKIEVLHCALFVVNSDFPSLTQNHLSEPMNSKVSNVSYCISLEGVSGQSCDHVNFGNFFY